MINAAKKRHAAQMGIAANQANNVFARIALHQRRRNVAQLKWLINAVLMMCAAKRRHAARLGIAANQASNVFVRIALPQRRSNVAQLKLKPMPIVKVRNLVAKRRHAALLVTVVNLVRSVSVRNVPPQRMIAVVENEDESNQYIVPI
jgi:hypothetical protein